MYLRVLFTLFPIVTLVSLTSADNGANTVTNQKPSSSTTGFELSQAYQVGAHVDGSGRPSGHLNLFGGGKIGPGQQHSQYYANEEQSHPQPQPPPYYVQPAAGTSLWSGGYSSSFLTVAAYFAAGVLAAISSWYIFGVLGYSKRSIEDTEEVKKDEKAKSRRRRSVKADENLTDLTNMVLAAIESGECLQKSICLMGSQFGNGKGRLAATLLDKMIPANFQGSPYFVTFRGALRGEIYCDKIRCKH